MGGDSAGVRAGAAPSSEVSAPVCRQEKQTGDIWEAWAQASSFWFKNQVG